jgi:hypothetical protein
VVGRFFERRRIFRDASLGALSATLG